MTDSKSGIFPKSSRFNHACHPYATCTYTYSKEQGRLIVTTLRDIEVGEEITISYCGRGSPNNLMANYGFYCDCLGCPTPKVAAREARYLSEGFWAPSNYWASFTWPILYDRNVYDRVPWVCGRFGNSDFARWYASSPSYLRCWLW